MQSIPASYVVWKDGSTYRAECQVKDGDDLSGTDAADVIQSAVDFLSSGGKIFLRRGIYEFGSAVDIPHGGIAIVGEAPPCDTIVGVEDSANRVAVIRADGYEGITVNDNDGDHDVYVTGVLLKNLILDGRDGGGEAAIRSWGRYVTIEDVIATSFNVGISLEWTDEVSCGDSWLNRVVCRDNAYEGIKVQSNDNQFTNIYSHYNQHGMLLKDKGGLLATNIHLWGNDDNGLKIVKSVNDHFLNLYTETNGDYGIFIGVLEGTVQNQKFMNIYSWGNTLGAIHIDGAGETLQNLTFLGGRVEGTVDYANITNLTIDYVEGFVTRNNGSSTGTGAAQSFAHGFDGDLVPNDVTIVPTVSDATVTNVWADATNIHCTVSAGKTYNWSAKKVGSLI